LKALITGITGQDGSYLAEHLLSLGYEVHGLVRRVALENPEGRFHRIAHILDKVTLHPASLESYPSIFHVVSKHAFDECYHLAAQSFVAESFGDGFSTMNTNINGTHYMLAALRELRPKCRFYFAGSSEMFGKVEEVPQRETTRFHPRSPYGISKVAGFELTRNYREAYGMFTASGILFNHEGPRRGFEFVTRKITSTAARIKVGRANELRLGNLDARRDWGHSQDYVRAMHLMLQLDAPDDFSTFRSAPHHTGSLENAQVLGDRLACHRETARELRDGERTILREARHQLEPRLIAERREDGRRVGRLCGCGCPGSHWPRCFASTPIMIVQPPLLPSKAWARRASGRASKPDSMTVTRVPCGISSSTNSTSVIGSFA